MNKIKIYRTEEWYKSREEMLERIMEYHPIKPKIKPVPYKKVNTLKENRQLYYKIVWKLTKQNDLSVIPNIHLRKFGEWDLDHMVSIAWGFRNNILPYYIASIDNLQIISHTENRIKKDTCIDTPLYRMLCEAII